MTYSESSDTDLLVASRTRPELLGVVYERHAPAVYRYLGRRVGVGAAEDLLGEAYWRTISSYHQGTGPTLRREIWMGHTAAGALKDARVGSGIVSLDVGSFDGFTWDQLYALPTDSRALEGKLRATSLNGGRDDNSELFTLVGSLISESPAPPVLRKALWEIAARIPGVTLVGAVRDSIGRPGIEIRRDFEGYVLDPKDGRLLERYEGTSAPVPEEPGGTNWRATFLEQGPVDSAPAATPRVRQTP